MTRTTPRRPIDLTSVVPELAPYARVALRLHPRRGTPSVTDSSVGGPLLWPIDEPWPTCDEDHGLSTHGSPVTIDGVRRARALTHDRWVLGRTLTEDESREFDAIVDGGAASHLVDERPIPLLPILQLHLRDAHGVVVGPEVSRRAGSSEAGRR
jgi:hypothetical protein